MWKGWLEISKSYFYRSNYLKLLKLMYIKIKHKVKNRKLAQ